jgi:hypothetical protein
MKAVVTRLLIAVIFFAGAAICWGEAALARRVADAQARLATLHYDLDDGIGAEASALNRLAVPVVSLDEEIRRRRAHSEYWRTRTENGDSAAAAPIAPLPGARGANPAEDPDAGDPQLMFLATNQAFRAATRDISDRARAVERLDLVVQAYGEVLRGDSGNADASYNYEYAVRLRDTIARARGAARPRAAPSYEPERSFDLPPGPTIHGLPGGPPPEIPGDQFRTIAPMPYEEREESDPGRGPTPQRRG